jgi:glycosyltransferase involved in cell wall biosynthesis
MSAENPRVALVSVGLGRIRRGFERTISGIFDSIRNDLDVTLFRREGPCTPGECLPPLLPALSACSRLVPMHLLMKGEEYGEYKRDCLAYALALLPQLLRDRFDVMHCIDPPFAKILDRLGTSLPIRPRIIFTDGCVIPPELYPSNAHIHYVADEQFRRAAREGVPRSRMTLVPCGLHTDEFSKRMDRAALRRRHNIGPDTFVVLSVSAIKRIHKRVDHIIREVSSLTGDVLLWLDGHMEDSEIPLLARSLGHRCRITHVPTDQVPELHQVADVMVHAATSESFGIAIVEAIASGVMTLVHDDPHFEWLVGDRRCLVDMNREGALAGRLAELMRNPSIGRDGSAERARRVRERFDWRTVGPAYSAMYRNIAAMPHAGVVAGRSREANA